VISRLFLLENKMPIDKRGFEYKREDKARAGRRRVELHGQPGTADGLTRGGKTAIALMTREQIVLGGKSGSRENKAKGGRRSQQLYGQPSTPEGCAEGGRHASHNYWHRRRGMFNFRCSYCLLEIEKKNSWGIPVEDPSN
jgi:hypothetical protein